MRKTVLSIAMGVLLTVATSVAYGYELRPYALAEHRDYVQAGKTIYTGMMAGLGMDIGLFEVQGINVTVNGKIYTGKLDTRIISAWSVADSDSTLGLVGGFTAPKIGFDDVVKSVNMHGESLGLTVSRAIVSTQVMTVVPALGVKYDRETISEARGLHSINSWDWYFKNVCKGHAFCGLTGNAVFGSTTDRLSVVAGLGAGWQLNKDWAVGAGATFGLPVAGKSRSQDAGVEIKNRGFDAAAEAGIAYKKWILAAHYGYSLKNIAAQGYTAGDDSPLRAPYHVHTYGVSIRYAF